MLGARNNNQEVPSEIWLTNSEKHRPTHGHPTLIVQMPRPESTLHLFHDLSYE